MYALYSDSNSHIIVPTVPSDVSYLITYTSADNRLNIDGATCVKEQTSCGLDQFCLFTYADKYNSHISSCTNNPYGNKICCIVDTSFVCNNNGVMDSGEFCDGTDFGLSGGSTSCADFNPIYVSGELSCNDCIINVSACSMTECGNNIIEAGEQCEIGADLVWGTWDDNLTGENCSTQSWDNGPLRCYPTGHGSQCLFNESGCFDDTTSDPPVAGPNEYYVYTPCGDDGNGDEYGISNWTVYTGEGTELDTGSVLCYLDSSDIPLFGGISFVFFIIILGGFYYNEKFKSEVTLKKKGEVS